MFLLSVARQLNEPGFSLLPYHPPGSKWIHEQIPCYTLEINFACFTQCFQHSYMVRFVVVVHYLWKYLNNLKNVRFRMVWPTRGPTFSDTNCKISLCQSSYMLYPILCYTEQNKAGSWNDCSNILSHVGSTTQAGMKNNGSIILWFEPPQMLLAVLWLT